MDAWLIVALTAIAMLTTVFGFVFTAKRDAADAKNGVETHEPRLRQVETQCTLNSAAIESQCERIDEIRADVKEVLRRLGAAGA